MPDAHNVVGVATRRHFNNSPGSFWPGCRRSATSTPTPTRSEVEINYYVIEESNCDRQRCGKPLAMAANRFTSSLSETHTHSHTPPSSGLPAAHVFISHTLCSTSSASSAQLSSVAPSPAVGNLRNKKRAFHVIVIVCLLLLLLLVLASLRECCVHCVWGISGWPGIS